MRITTSFLNERVAQNQSALDRFRKDHDDVWEVIDGAFTAVSALIGAVVEDVRETDWNYAATVRFLNWQCIVDYQTESLFLLIGKQFDAGFAIVRMATELARDNARLAQWPELLELWRGRVKPGPKRTEYRKKFKFDETEPVEKYVLKLYNVASDFSLHGHVVGHMAAATSRLRSAHGRMTAVYVGDEQVHEALVTWLYGFFPVHRLCAQGFTDLDGPNIRDALRMFTEYESQMLPVLQKYSKAVDSLVKEAQAKRDH